ncbi:MAG: hypothetical protein ACOX9C_07230 [Kiritimatiellia bacterium]|jgi:hypothetical protein
MNDSMKHTSFLPLPQAKRFIRKQPFSGKDQHSQKKCKTWIKKMSCFGCRNLAMMVGLTLG